MMEYMTETYTWAITHEKEFLIKLKIEYFFFTTQISKKVENNKRNPKGQNDKNVSNFPNFVDFIQLDNQF